MLPEWTALFVGIVIATLATMVGIGGGILWAPYLIFIAGVAPQSAVLASLIIQIAGMGSGSIAALRNGGAGLSIAGIMALAALPGVIAGVALGVIIQSDWLVFALGAASLATALVFVSAREDYEFQPKANLSASALIPHLWAPPLFSVLTGLLSVGVGDFLVPLLRARVGMKMRTAIGICLVVMTINAAVAAAIQIGLGVRPPMTIIGWALLGVLIGGQIGPRLAGKIPDQALKEIFIYGLSLVGIHILFNA
jgi:hypothetical protein